LNPEKNIEPFNEGLAIIVVKGKYGYLNKNGIIQINPKYDSATNFINGSAVVSINNEFGFINKKSNFILIL
jgi:hypothetical protein